MNKKILIILYGLDRQQLLAAPLIAKIKQMSFMSEVHLLADAQAKENVFLLQDVSYFHFVNEESLDVRFLEQYNYQAIFNFSPHIFARQLTSAISAEEKIGFIQLQNGEPSWTSSWFKHIEQYQDNEGRDLFHLLDLWRFGLKLEKISFPKTREIDEYFQTLAFSPILNGDERQASNIYKMLQNIHAMNIGLSFQWLATNDEDYRLACKVAERHNLPLKIILMSTADLKQRLSEVSLLVTDNQSLIRAADFFTDVPILALCKDAVETKKLGPYRKGNWILTPLQDNTGLHLWNEILVSELISKIMKLNEVELFRWSQENAHLLMLYRTNLFLDGNLWSAVPVDTHFRVSHFRSLIENVVWILALNEEKNIGSAAFTLAHEIGVQDHFLKHLIFWETEASWLEGKLNAYTWLEKNEKDWQFLTKRVDNSQAWRALSTQKNETKNLKDMRRQKEFKELNIKRIQIKGRLIQQIQSFVKEPSA